MNEEKIFNIDGHKVLELWTAIQILQSLERALPIVKIMLADNTEALAVAKAAIETHPDYESDPDSVLGAEYQVTGYQLTPEQLPPGANVAQVRAIRPFVKA
jgi:uncharacterized iron-regulated membrane protein